MRLPRSGVMGVALGLAAGFGPASAQPDESAAYRACVAAAGGVITDVRVCIGEELARQTARMTRAYDAAAGRSPPGRRAALRASQRRWVRARSARCDQVLRDEGGMAAQLAIELSANCVLDETRTRAGWLARWRG